MQVFGGVVCHLKNELNIFHLSKIKKLLNRGGIKLLVDRKNEIVFIGQDMDQDQILSELNLCLLSDEELNTINLETGFEDEWPVPRAYAL